MSRAFVYGQGHLDRPILAVVGLLLGGFLVYAAAVATVLRRPHTVRLGSVLLFAVLFRLAFLPSQVIQEDDVYRYIWDGQVSLQGISPYDYAPARVLAFEEAPASVRAEDRTTLIALSHLAGAGEDVAPLEARATTHARRHLFSRINYPDVPTIYPPAAQAVFAAIQFIVPWSPRGTRTALLFFDGLCILLILGILNDLHLHPSRVLIYAWSPLVLKEFANSGHMDTVAMAAVLLCVWCLMRRRWIAACVSLAVGVATKYFPIVLVPIVWQRLRCESRRVALAGLAAFLLVLALCFGPFLRDGLKMFEGLWAYMTSWQMNAGLFAILEWIARGVVGDAAPDVARLAACVLFLGILVWGMRGAHALSTPLVMTQRMCVVLGGLFLLSPVGDPWYLCWMVPLLCVHPWRPWLLLTGLVQLYYVGFFVEYHYPAPQAGVLWTAIKVVEYLPFYVLVLWAVWRQPRASTAVGGGSPP